MKPIYAALEDRNLDDQEMTESEVAEYERQKEQYGTGD